MSQAWGSLITTAQLVRAIFKLRGYPEVIAMPSPEGSVDRVFIVRADDPVDAIEKTGLAANGNPFVTVNVEAVTGDYYKVMFSP